MKIQIHIEKQIAALKEALVGARTQLVQAGKIVAALVDSEPEAYEMILKKIPSLTLSGLETLERIGRGKLDERLVTDASPAAERAMRMALPIEEQRTLIDRPVAVVEMVNGHVNVQQKRLPELTGRDAKLLIGETGLRSVAEQTALLEAQATRDEKLRQRYHVESGVVVFHANVRMTWAEMMEVAKQIEPKAADIESSIKRRQIAA